MFKILNPNFFYNFSSRYLFYIFLAFSLSMSAGLYYALFSSPPDYQQGETVRIMYIHVPAAWMSLSIYAFMAACSFSNLVWKTPLTFILAVAAAPIGASFALITLISGSIWGKPMWGTWWVWDARLTSMLILFLLYISYIIIINCGDKMRRAEKPASVIALVGIINLPIVKFSVDIWYSLHQPASIIRLQGPAIHKTMLLPLMVMFLAFILYFLLIFILRIKILLDRVKKEGGL